MENIIYSLDQTKSTLFFQTKLLTFFFTEDLQKKWFKGFWQAKL